MARVEHPVYPAAASPERIEGLKQAVAPLMEIGEAEMVALAPDRTGFRGLGCSNCFFPHHEIPGRVGYRIRTAAFRLGGTS